MTLLPQSTYMTGLMISTILISACTQPNQIINMRNSQQNISKPFSPIVSPEDIPTATQTIQCDDITDYQTITIKGHTRLSDHCNLSKKSVRFILDTSHSSLDCRGATLSQAIDDQRKVSAITIRPKHNRAIHNITVANCHITGYSHALHIRQKHNPNIRYLKGITDLKSNQKTAPHDIRVINISSNQSKTSGIYVDDHSYHVHFSDLLIRQSGTVGLYFEFGTQRNIVENSVFVDNGFRTFKPNREAIAIDSSANNIIINNQFIHNGLGGIMLYRNCFEHANNSQKNNHFKRTQSSHDNMIKNNTFIDEPVGIWVASRQSRNLIGFQCGAYLLKQTTTARYHLDSAKNNDIIGNTFQKNNVGIIVEDDATIIQNNLFYDMSKAIAIGSAIKEETAEKSGGAVKGTVLKNNKLNGASIDIRPASQATTQYK